MRFAFRAAATCALAIAISTPAMARHHRLPKVASAVTSAPAQPAPTVPAAPAKPSLTLDEALGVAYETNPQLAAQQASLRATDEGVAIANGGWRATIPAGGTSG